MRAPPLPLALTVTLLTGCAGLEPSRFRLDLELDKTAVVAVIDRKRHPRYDKTVQRTNKLYVHDEENDLNVGDRVRIAETRPLSKLKRWRLVEVVERAR